MSEHIKKITDFFLTFEGSLEEEKKKLTEILSSTPAQVIHSLSAITRLEDGICLVTLNVARAFEWRILKKVYSKSKNNFLFVENFEAPRPHNHQLKLFLAYEEGLTEMLERWNMLCSNFSSEKASALYTQEANFLFHNGLLSIKEYKEAQKDTRYNGGKHRGN